jgi:putative 4-mercaptohistidine N1-methyltranferase
MYDDFSTPTFDGKHNLIKGGSWISTGNEATIHSRYAFRRHFYQHAGFRYVESDAPLKIQQADYETDEEITLSCEENWGDAYSDQPNLARQLSVIINDLIKNNSDSRILDLNADTGRLAFELARSFKDVTSLDFTARMIRIPIQLQEQGYVRYTMRDEGELMFYRDIVLSDFGLNEIKGSLLFMQADAMNLKDIYSGYDLIVVPSLLEELSDPKAFLSDIHTRVNDGGLLVIASDYQWDQKKTPRDKWPGGFKQDGEPVTSFDGISSLLNNNFVLHSEPQDLIQIRKKSSRLSEKRILQVTVWKKR